MLKTAGHLAPVWSLAFTPDGEELVSAGDDKVVRVWSLQKAKTVRLIRAEAGPANHGKIYALALSPNGHWLAVGGSLGPVESARPPEQMERHKIRLYDFTTGKLVALLLGHKNVVRGLSFSPDSSKLISAGYDKRAIIWDVETHTVMRRISFLPGDANLTSPGKARDSNVGDLDSHAVLQRLEGEHKDRVSAAAFSHDGQHAVTASWDGSVRLWQVDTGRPVAILEHDRAVRALAVSPVDSTIAVGSADGKVRLWRPLGPDKRPKELANQAGAIASLSFSRNGKQLISSCYWNCQGAPVRVWAMPSRHEQSDYSEQNYVGATALGPNASLAATTGGDGSIIHVWDTQTGKTRLILKGENQAVWSVGFSRDSARIAWGHQERCPPASQPCPNAIGELEYQLPLPTAQRRLGVPRKLNKLSAVNFIRATVTHGKWSLRPKAVGGQFLDYGHEKHKVLQILQDGTLFGSARRGEDPLADGNRHSAFTFSTDGKTIISGGSYGVLTALDLHGNRVGSFDGHESDIWALSVSPDGTFLASASNDHTVRLWNLKTRELIVNIFHSRNGEWVIWTPQGYYTCSPGADRFVGWQFNRGAGAVPDYIGANDLRKHLHRPDIVEDAIRLASAEAAIKNAHGTRLRLADLRSQPLPSVKIVSPAMGARVSGGRTSITVAATEIHDPIKRFVIRVNGIQIAEQTARTAASKHNFSVPLARGENRIVVIAENDIGQTEATLNVVHVGVGDLDKRGTLFILAIGVDRYPGLGKACDPKRNNSCDLRFAGADAKAFAKAAHTQLGPQHRKSDILLLTNDPKNSAPTTANIRRYLSDIRNRAMPEDTVIVFIAGHGVNDRADYLFLPTDAKFEGRGWAGDRILPWVELERIIHSTRGRRYLFVDTCHSANAYHAKLGNAAFYADIVAFASAGVDEQALELTQLQHGLFTYAVLDGLGGHADRNGDELIRVSELGQYLTERTKTLINEHYPEFKGQLPVPETYRGRDAADHVLAHL
ncbi:MAG: Ig-like domain-containing protein [Hyphomicrobiaceae bacterium]